MFKKEVFRFNTKVLSVTSSDPKSKEEMYYVSVKNFKDGSTSTEGPFHHIAVCSGSNVTPARLTIVGLESFQGPILHTTNFASKKGTVDDNFSAVSAKRVVTIGIGEAMADILHLMTTMQKPPEKISASVRGGAFIIMQHPPAVSGKADGKAFRHWQLSPEESHRVTISGKRRHN